MTIKLDQNHKPPKSGTQPAPNPSDQTSKLFEEVQEEISRMIRKIIQDFKAKFS